MIGRREVQAGTARLERQHHGACTRCGLEIVDHPVTRTTAEAAVIALDRLPGALAQVRSELLAPRRKVGEDEDLLVSGEHRLDDLIETVEFPERPSRPSSSAW